MARLIFWVLGRVTVSTERFFTRTVNRASDRISASPLDMHTSFEEYGSGRASMSLKSPSRHVTDILVSELGEKIARCAQRNLFWSVSTRRVTDFSLFELRLSGTAVRRRMIGIWYPSTKTTRRSFTCMALMDLSI